MKLSQGEEKRGAVGMIIGWILSENVRTSGISITAMDRIWR